jgi:hypothetical protein
MSASPPTSPTPTLREALEAWRDGSNALAKCLLRRLEAEDARRAAGKGRDDA